jgi:hypothetical protein
MKFSIRKFDGDDIYSWAVFYAKDVKGMRGPIFYGQAKPVMCGMSRTEAGYQRDSLEKKFAS